MGFLDKISHAWNAFNDTPENNEFRYGSGSSYTPGRYSNISSLVSGDKNIIDEIVNKIAIHISNMEFVHARLDENERYIDVIDSGFNNCLNVEANIDQNPTHFKLDLATTILLEGVAAVVPIDTTIDPAKTGGFDILTARVGKIVEWLPQHVRVNIYDEREGVRKDILLPKSYVAIIENPHYEVMNKPNSSFQRLLRKLALLDGIDNEMGSKKLDIIIKLPYTVKSEKRQQMAEAKRRDLEMQLRQSEIGVGYIDATDNITQLNRPLENNLLPEIQHFTEELYSKLGVTKGILEGTSSQQEILNFQTQTIEPIVNAIMEEFNRKFLTKTARTQRQSFIYQRKPYKMVPMADIAEMADKFTRNEIMTTNEVRSWVGLKPSTDPKADELRNSNMPRKDTDGGPQASEDKPVIEKPRQNGKDEDET